MIRILHVLGRLDRGGAETMIMSLYRNIDRKKVQFDFVVHTTDHCDYDDEIRSLGGRIYSIPSYSGKNHLQYKKAWNDFFKKHKEHKIVHAHMRSTATIYLKVAKKYGLTTIAHSHNISSGKGVSAIVKDVLQYPIRNIADHLIACSENAGQWLFGKGVTKRDNYYILKNAIDAENFIYDEDARNRMRKELGIEGKFGVGNVARFHPQKNHTFLINAFKEVYDRNDNAILLLVGQGELRKDVEKQVHDLGITDNVLFTGVRSDIPDLLQAMDVFVFPSLFEGLGIVAVEAQASGLKCVVADTIPKEAFVTELITPIPLNESPVKWAQSILKASDYTRENTYQNIYDSGYEVKDTSKWMETFYLQKGD